MKVIKKKAAMECTPEQIQKEVIEYWTKKLAAFRRKHGLDGRPAAMKAMKVMQTKASMKTAVMKAMIPMKVLKKKATMKAMKALTVMKKKATMKAMKALTMTEKKATMKAMKVVKKKAAMKAMMAHEGH